MGAVALVRQARYLAMSAHAWEQAHHWGADMAPVRENKNLEQIYIIWNHADRSGPGQLKEQLRLEVDQPNGWNDSQLSWLKLYLWQVRMRSHLERFPGWNAPHIRYAHIEFGEGIPKFDWLGYSKRKD